MRLAYLEPRTELPNRHLFTKTATEALIEAQLRGRRLTLLCIAPEYLKTAGSPRTDVAVRDSLARLVEGLRPFDGLVQHATTEQRASPLACIDGAYLVVLVQDPASAAAKTSLVANIVAALEAGVPTVAHHDKDQTIGQACFPRDGNTIESLLQSAILATLEVTTVAKTDAKLADDLRDDLGAELSDALDRDQICLYYQPRVCIRTQQVLGAEALLRWQHPLRGPLVARELLRIAELTGLTARVTGWALRAAVAQAAAWSSLRETRIPVSVNISATQLARPDFANELIALLAEAGLDPALLEIEVGEVYLDVNDAISAQLLELRAAGVGLIVDDFGHGRIALSALRRLRIDGFKVNHVTLRELQAEGDSGIYDLAASIARVRHAVLIGKGIENAAELALAAAKGCDQAQGFHICQPLPASDFARFARAAIPTAAAG